MNAQPPDHDWQPPPVTDIPVLLAAIEGQLHAVLTEIRLLASLQRNILSLIERTAGKPLRGDDAE